MSEIKSVSLHNITNEMLSILQEIESQDEVKEDQMALITNLNLSFDEKVRNVAWYIKHLENDSDYCHDEEVRLANIRRAKENRIKQLKDYAKFEMERLGFDKIQSPDLTITLQNNPMSCEIINEKLVPEQYKTKIETVKINKDDIIKDHKAGLDISGVEFRKGKHIRFK